MLQTIKDAFSALKPERKTQKKKLPEDYLDPFEQEILRNLTTSLELLRLFGAVELVQVTGEFGEYQQKYRILNHEKLIKYEDALTQVGIDKAQSSTDSSLALQRAISLPGYYCDYIKLLMNHDLNLLSLADTDLYDVILETLAEGHTLYSDWESSRVESLIKHQMSVVFDGINPDLFEL